MIDTASDPIDPIAQARGLFGSGYDTNYFPDKWKLRKLLEGP